MQQIQQDFEGKMVSEHCRKCRFYGGDASIGSEDGVWCNSPYGSMGCFEYYMTKEEEDKLKEKRREIILGEL